MFVYVGDINDNLLEFFVLVYLVNFWENVVVGIKFLLVLVIDKDVG